MSSSALQRLEVLRYFYSVLLILGVTTLILGCAAVVGYLAEVGMRERLGSFHLRSSMLVSEASQRVARLQLLRIESPDGESPVGVRRQAELALRATSEALTELEGIQRAWEARSFAESLTRANRQHAEVQRIFEQAGLDSPDLALRLEAVSLTLFQLGRLHSIAADDLLGEISATSRRVRTVLTAVIAIGVLLSGILIVRTLTLLRAALRRHATTTEALFEREQQLQQASKMEALGTLVGGVAHDFNNLLTAILGHSDTLQVKLGPDDPSAEDLRQITKAGERAATLTRQLLAFSRHEPVEVRSVDLNLLLRDLKPLLRRLLPTDIELSVDLDPELRSVKADPVQIEQAVVNLAINARDAMPAGGSVTIQTRRELIDEGDTRLAILSVGRYARVSVEDNGCGMDPALRARIFEPFFTTKEQGKGTGLGLSTVHGIVTRSKGHITVDSKTGEGTRFDVYLPEANGRLTSRRANGTGPLPPGAAGTILLAEDDDDVRQLTASGLRQAGYEVLVGCDGEEALELCARHDGPIDLILTDVVMPRLRGPAFVKRAAELLPDTRVVYMSGYTNAETLGGAGDSEAPLVHKPFKLQHLLEVIATELERGREERKGLA